METFACSVTTRDRRGHIVDFHAGYVPAGSFVGGEFTHGAASVTLPAAGWPQGYTTEFACSGRQVAAELVAERIAALSVEVER